MNLSVYFLAFVPIFVAVDALGMIPIFMSLTRGIPKEKKSPADSPFHFNGTFGRNRFSVGGKICLLMAWGHDQ